MILVTGGTGLVGSHLLLALVQQQQPVRAIHRTSSDLNEVRKVFRYFSHEADALFEKIEWIEANILDIPALTDAFQGITKVYHAAAYISFNTKHYRKLKKANVEGTANIVNFCLANNVTKLCYVSSVATLGSKAGGLIDETTFWNPEAKNSVYAITKYGAEMEVWRGTQEGLPAVIVHPGIILGEGHWSSGSGALIARAAKGLNYAPTGGMGVVDVKDVVHAMIALMDGSFRNDHFILVGENVTYRTLLTDLAVRFGKTPPQKKLPRWIMLVLSKLDRLSALLFGTKRKLPKATVRSMYKESYYDASKLVKALDFRFTPYAATLDRITENYSSGGKESDATG
ncbi:NAD-dependent epimerase/dehydratase family protein [Altibacter lentus]|uniref:NAD-dependent epimerase/dehydratase family protein n=1 Tax=Altibacter lentus TaxID=1223410 RepID=UPI000552E324|nr:NAD-dependent epimerase/dehydratase family protein [Altibacter lentus]